jgi:hypothetical protein
MLDGKHCELECDWFMCSCRCRFLSRSLLASHIFRAYNGILAQVSTRSVLVFTSQNPLVSETQASTC